VHGTIEQLLRVEWRPLADLASVADPWRVLAGRTLEPNIFYEPAFALAAEPVFGRDVSVCLVWSSSAPPCLLGLFPARIERWRLARPLPVLAGWTHPYAPLGVPLVDRDAADAVIGAWLDHIAAAADLPGLLLMPMLPTEGPVARAINAALARRGGRSAVFGRHRRALLGPAGRRAGYLEHALGAKKRKELRRQRRRLGDAGVVRCDSCREPPAVSRALEDFLALEAGGWKGRAGTAAHAQADVRRFVEAAVTALAREGKARIDRLSVDGRTIAALVLLYSGATAWTWKIAYDESFARASPGMQLLADVTQALLDDTGIARADSCAAAGHPMINHVWRERLPLADRLISLRGGIVPFSCACMLEGSRRAGFAAAKAIHNAFRR
jgi:hypothetical protein